MSHDKSIYNIAMNLLLPPVSMKISRVATVLSVPYQTVYKWNKDRLLENPTVKQVRNTPALTNSRGSAKRTKIVPSRASRKNNLPNQNTDSIMSKVDKCKVLTHLVEDY
jgi:predicted site-specific integrase-resolvase